MHDLLFENQDALDENDLLEYAREEGLNRSDWVREIEACTFTERVLEDYRSGAQSGVRSTPAFLINGVRHKGDYDLDSLLSALTMKRAA